ncbi:MULTISPECIES: hypothetical protein [unclassified Nostoc]|uniref:hypothetical protein n=1 Tax=unclassified Nostoc TaxID=2593658 RepID=UPI001D22F098|nr:hypothetical protein [Nostoc sp. JL23]MBN3877249.1 hypothetical protein [Nostoc sp. JL23]
MERLRISDLSFCEDEVSDLSQVLGGFASAYVANYSYAIKSSYKIDKSGISAEISGAIAGGIAGAITDGNKAIASVVTSAKVS